MAVPVSTGRRRRGGGRRALLEAAIHVVASKGLRGLTYRAVAEEAGVTHGLVAHHFGSRAALIKEALEFAASESIDASSVRSESGQVGDFATGLAGLVSSTTELQVFQYELALEAHRQTELLAEVREVYTRFIDEIALELADLGLGDDEPLAHLVFAALDGLVMQQLVFGRAELTETSVRRLQQLLRQIGARDQLST